MTARTGATPEIVDTPTAQPFDTTRVFQEGIVAGLLGAATIALWFFLLDGLAGRPLHTPTVLGTALFRRGAGLASPETLAVSLEMVLMFTWVHAMAFAVLGGVASWLLGLAERHPSFGFGVLLLFVVFQFAFVAAAMIFAAPVLKILTWPAILVANLIAAAVMAAYFWRRHPTLVVRP
jgi:hypothetical protein